MIFGVRGTQLAVARGPYYAQLNTMVGTFKVHHIVALAFLGPKPDGYEVDHIDGDSFNNAASNLRYVTHTENMTARQTQTTKCRKGHEFTPENTIWRNERPRPRRRCKTCLRAWETERAKVVL